MVFTGYDFFPIQEVLSSCTAPVRIVECTKTQESIDIFIRLFIVALASYEMEGREHKDFHVYDLRAFTTADNSRQL